MLRRHQRFWQFLQVLRDLGLAVGAFYLAYLVRFSNNLSTTLHEVFNFAWPLKNTTLIMVLLICLLWPAVGFTVGLYASQRTRGLFQEILSVFKTAFGTFMALVLASYFINEVRYSRGVLILFAVFAGMLVTSARLVGGYLLFSLRSQGYNLRHVLVIGSGELAQRLLVTLHEQAHLGLRVRGVITHPQEAWRVGLELCGVPVVGVLSELPELLERQFRGAIDQVFIALPLEQLTVLKDLMTVLSQETVDVRLLPDIDQYITLCGSVEELSGYPVLNLQATPLFGVNLWSKRLFDLFFASLAILLTLPLTLLLALLVKLTSKGPIFYQQERMGMDGQCFKMYKFRTMGLNAECGGAQMAKQHDQRCTPLGRFLRRFSLDEIPQLFNVLLGDMSLVGPRPERPCFIQEFKKEIPRYALRHKIKAGMTGWAQINGKRGNTSIAERIELDLYYIENWSLAFDLMIIIRTFLGGFLSPHAY